MQLPILSSLSELFSKVTEDFKSLFQAWSLVAAGLFLFLNLLLVYPLARGIQAVKAFEGLDKFIQVAVATFALFLFGYLVNSLSSFFVALAGGQAFRGSLIDGMMRRGQRRRYDRLKSRLDPVTHDQPDINRAAYRLAYEFPREDYIRSTRLGNVHAAVADYSANQYGAHLDTVWPVLEAALVKDEDKLLEKIGAEQTSMTFLCALSGLLVFTAFTAVPARLFLGRPLWAELLILSALLVVGYVTYRAAVGRAAAWARLVRTALDLHLGKAAAALGLRPLEGDDLIDGDKARWQAVSEWLVYGGLVVKTGQPVELPQRLTAWYDDEAAKPTHALSCSAQLEADIHAARQTSGNPVITTEALTLPGPSFEYTITITHQAAEGDPTPLQFRSPVGGFVRVTDKAIPFITAPVEGWLHRPNGTLNAPVTAITGTVEGGPDALLWPIANLDYRDSAALIYRLDSAVQLTLHNATFVSAAPARSGRKGLLRLAVTAPGYTEWAVHAGPAAEERVKGDAICRSTGVPANQVKAEYDPAARRATWKFPKTAAGEVAALIPFADHGLKAPLFAPSEEKDLMLPPTGEPPAFNSPGTGYLYQIMRTVPGAADFPGNTNSTAEWRDAKAAAAALDRYDLMSDDEARGLGARDLNNLGCFFAWQAAPDPAGAMRQLAAACAKANALPEDDEKRQLLAGIRRNMGALAQSEGQVEAEGKATGGGSGVRIGLPDVFRGLAQNVRTMIDPNRRGGL